MKIYVNHYGWVMGIIRTGKDVIGLKFTKHKAGAKPFKGDWDVDGDAYDALRYAKNTLKCHVDKVFCPGSSPCG